MLTQDDKNFIKETSTEIISYGETIQRKRLTATSYDAEFGEINGTWNEDIIEFVAKIFFEKEEFLMDPSGKEVQIACKVHVTPDIDIQVGDILIIRSVEYRVREKIEAPLGGYNEFLVERIT